MAAGDGRFTVEVERAEAAAAALAGPVSVADQRAQPIPAEWLHAAEG